jgi:DNA invertase Pin-like site-specific DNA recombinase
VPKLSPRPDQGKTKLPESIRDTATGRRAACYLRVSTDRQEARNQRPALERLALARGFDVEWFEETVSGAKTRPVLDQMCAKTKRGDFEAVLVWALDRLGRSTWDVVDRVRALDAAGVPVISYQEPWLDLGGPARELLLGIFSWVASQERERLRERTRAGLARARSEGKRLGRPRISPLALARALSLLGEGSSWAEAAQRTGISRRTLARAVRCQKPLAPKSQEPRAS